MFLVLVHIWLIRNPAPIDRKFVPLFTCFYFIYPRWGRISSNNSTFCFVVTTIPHRDRKISLESTKYRMFCTRWHDIHKNPTTYAPGISQYLPLLWFAVDLPVIFTMLLTRWSTMYCTWRIIPSSKWLVTPIYMPIRPLKGTLPTYTTY